MIGSLHGYGLWWISLIKEREIEMIKSINNCGEVKGSRRGGRSVFESGEKLLALGGPNVLLEGKEGR